MDYSKFINLETWPSKPEEKKDPEQKDEFSEKVRQHFRDNPGALAELQKELKEQKQNSEPDIRQSLFSQPKEEGGISPEMEAYVKSKNNNK